MTRGREAPVTAPPIPRIEPVADFLDAAADYIKEHGWAREFETDHGRVCVLGAFQRVLMSTGDTEIYAQAAEAMSRRTRGNGVVSWNDIHPPFIGKRMVIRKLRKVARALRA